MMISKLYSPKALSKILGKRVDIGADGVSIDTRTIKANEVFIAIKGKKVNGSDFIPLALKKGAVLALTEDDIKNPNVIKIDDALQTLHKFARYNREIQNSNITTIGITGSNGKTTLKEMFAKVLPDCYYSKKNFNSLYGLPLSLANQGNKVKYSVLEMGMSAKGDIEILSNILRPDIAIITSIAPAHLGNFSSVKDIAYAKSEIFSGMNKGICVLNMGDKYYDVLREQALKNNMKIYTFGSEDADFYVCDIELIDNKLMVESNIFGSKLSYELNTINTVLPTLSSLVLGVSKLLGLNLKEVTKLLEDFSSIEGRGNIIRVDEESYFIDESYNSNPASLSNAINYLKFYKKAYPENKVFLILGDMLELGKLSKRLHIAKKDEIVAASIDKVFTIGENMNALYEELPATLQGSRNDSHEALVYNLKKHLQKKAIILVKGSRGMKMENVIKLCLD